MREKGKGPRRGSSAGGAKKMDIFDLYEVSPIKEVEESVPFECEMRVEGAKGSVRVWTSWDEGALTAVMCSRVYEKLKGEIGPLRPSVKRFRHRECEGVGGLRGV